MNKTIILGMLSVSIIILVGCTFPDTEDKIQENQQKYEKELADDTNKSEMESKLLQQIRNSKNVDTENTFDSNKQEEIVEKGYIDVKKDSWLSLKLLSIDYYNSELTIHFELTNIYNEDVENMGSYTPDDDTFYVDKVYVTDISGNKNMDTAKTTYNECNYLYSNDEFDCHSFEVHVKIKFEDLKEKFIINYQPDTWYIYSDSIIFYIQMKDNKYTSLSREDYFDVHLERDPSIPKIEVKDMGSLDKDSDVRMCTQNFWGIDLQRCLNKLSLIKTDPDICTEADDKEIEINCKHTFLHGKSRSLKSVVKLGVDVLKVCQELPEDNNIIGDNKNDCFYQIGSTGADKRACDFVGDRKESCLQGFESNNRE